MRIDEDGFWNPWEEHEDVFWNYWQPYANDNKPQLEVVRWAYTTTKNT